MLEMNFCTRSLPYTGSPGILRRRTHPLRGIYLLSYFCAALGRLAPYFERPCLRFSTPAASRVPRITWYRTPGRSFTRPPRTRTIECSCRLWPMPGMYVVTSALFVSRARATLRSAEFGFFGVCVYTRTHTPRFSGHPSRAGDFVFVRIFSGPYRTNWAHAGTLSPLQRETFASSHALANFAAQSYAGVMNRKGRLLNRGTAQVLRNDASPRGVNCICFQRRGFTRLCGAGAPFRPLFQQPRSVVLCSGAEDFPFTTRHKGPWTTAQV